MAVDYRRRMILILLYSMERLLPAPSSFPPTPSFSLGLGVSLPMPVCRQYLLYII